MSSFSEGKFPLSTKRMVTGISKDVNLELSGCRITFSTFFVLFLSGFFSFDLIEQKRMVTKIGEPLGLCSLDQNIAECIMKNIELMNISSVK